MNKAFWMKATLTREGLLKAWQAETGAKVMDEKKALMWMLSLIREAKAEPGIDVEAYGPLLRLEMHFAARYRAL
jgi:hypothetical protein